MPIHLKWRIPLVYLVLVGETSQRFKMPSTSFLSTTISGYAFKFLLKYISKNLFIYIITHIHIYTSTFVRASSCQFVNLFISRGVLFVIRIYREKVTIPQNKPCIFLEGASSRTTKIQWGDHDTTISSPTFTSLSENVVAKGILFQVAR